MAAGAPMTGGTGKYSYAKNSQFQREAFNSSKDLIKNVLVQHLDVELLISSNSSILKIADLGCSVGPNSFLTMENVIDAFEQKYQAQGHDTSNLEFHAFFNDQVDNDFNTLFASLPNDKRYYAAGVPGSFWGQLFPCSSISVAYSFSALHWISKIPKNLVDKNSRAWNKGKIHYTGAKKEVVEAYAAQFAEDMDVFLNARAKEIVRGGMIVTMLPGVPDGSTTHSIGLAFSFIEAILLDMVKEGLISQDQVDSFNIPHVYPSVEQISEIVKKNGCFRILKIELQNTRTDPKSPLDHAAVIMNFRAVAEGTFTNHFGNKIVDELFARADEKISNLLSTLDAEGPEIGMQLLMVLKRK